MASWCITKNGKWVSYRELNEESEYDDFSDIQQIYQAEWYWTEKKDEAKLFWDDIDARSFLAKKRGEFWKNAKIEKYKY